MVSPLDYLSHYRNPESIEARRSPSAADQQDLGTKWINTLTNEVWQKTSANTWTLTSGGGGGGGDVSFVDLLVDPSEDVQIDLTGSPPAIWSVGQKEADTGTLVINRTAPAGNLNINRTNFGVLAGAVTQAEGSTAIGYRAGEINQASTSVALGAFSGQTGQDFRSVAIGYESGNLDQGNLSVSIGWRAAFFDQRNDSIAIGRESGETTCQFGCVLIGSQTGRVSSSADAVCIGRACGENASGTRSVNIGAACASLGSATNSVNIGFGCVGTAVTGRLAFGSLMEALAPTASAGGGAAAPATVEDYMTIEWNGQVRKIPLYLT